MAPGRKGITAMWAKLVRCFDRVAGVLNAVTGLIILFMVLNVTYAVVMRYAFQRAQLWAEELNGFLLVVSAYLAFAHAERAGVHVKTDAIVARLPSRPRALARAVACLLAIAPLSILVWRALEIAMRSLREGTTTAGGIDLPLFPAQIFVPIGGVLLGLALLISFIDALAVVMRPVVREADHTVPAARSV